MQNTLIKKSSLAAIIFFHLTLLGCGGEHNVDGTVVDSNNQPVEGVTIDYSEIWGGAPQFASSTYYPATTQTDENGQYFVQTNTKPHVSYSFISTDITAKKDDYFIGAAKESNSKSALVDNKATVNFLALTADEAGEGDTISEIISASPNSTDSAIMKLGEEITFKIEAHEHPLFASRILWSLQHGEGIARGFYTQGNILKFMPTESTIIYGAKLTASLQSRVWHTPSYTNDLTFGYTTLDEQAWTLETEQTQPIWQGSIWVGDMTDLSFLEGFNEVTGDIFVVNTQLETLDDLAELEIIRGDLIVKDNVSLHSLDGLANVTTLGGLELQNNPSLISLTGLSALTTVKGNIVINNNLVLTSLNDLTALESVVDLKVTSNPALTNLGEFTHLNTLNWLKIVNNPSLASISGFNSVEKISYSVFIDNNPALTTIDGLSTVKSTPSLVIFENEKLDSLAGLSNLQEATRTSITNNDSLTTVNELAALCKVEILNFTGNPMVCQSEVDQLIESLTQCGGSELYLENITGNNSDC